MKLKKAVIGMIHLGALPGSAGARLSVGRIVKQAAGEARLLKQAGFDGVLIENMHDAPYVLGPHGAEVVAAMTAAAVAVRDETEGLILGVQVLALGNKEALAIALAAGGDFIRAENFVFSHVADEGLMPTAEAGGLLRYRKTIGAERIAVFADLKKKHASHAITSDVSLGEACHAAEFFQADGVIITGAHTGDPARAADLSAARQATKLPVLVGSGATAENIGGMLKFADGVIVGSALKKGGKWTGPVDAGRCAALLRAADKAR